MLAVSALNQSYGGSHTLWDVDLRVPAGSRTCLMGRNGMGKTTLLKCIMGLLPATSGTIQFEGRDLRTRSPEDRAGLGIGYVPQGREIFPQLTVGENLAVGLGLGKGRVSLIPDLVFELFPVLKQMLGRRGGDLSGDDLFLPISSRGVHQRWKAVGCGIGDSGGRAPPRDELWL